ncbi:MAG TPA: hypothetical protein VH393_03630 [Ktedonobacterales bacterium]
MKRALLILAILGILAWIATVALLVVLTQSQPTATPTPADGSLPWFVPVFGLLQWIVPALGLVVGILGAVDASGRHDARWTRLFITLAVLVVALLVLSFVVAVALALFVLPFGKPSPVVDAIATVTMDLSFLFPIVVFVAALLYVVRGGAQSEQATGRS